MRGVILSGPAALKGLRLSNFLQTWYGWMVGNWSTAGKKAGKLCRSKGGTSSFTDRKNWFRVVTSSSLVRIVPKMMRVIYEFDEGYLVKFY